MGDKLVLTCKRLNEFEQTMKGHVEKLTSTQKAEGKETREKEDKAEEKEIKEKKFRTEEKESREEIGFSQFPIPESALYALIKMKCGIYTYATDESKKIETLSDIRKLLRLYNNYFINDKSSLYVFKPKKDYSWYKRILPIEEYPPTIEKATEIIEFEKAMCNSYYNTIIGFVYRQLENYEEAEKTLILAINKPFFDAHPNYKPYRFLTPLQQLIIKKESEIKDPQNKDKKHDIKAFSQYLNQFGQALEDKVKKTQYQEMISYFKVAAIELTSYEEDKDLSKTIDAFDTIREATTDTGYEELYLLIKDIKTIIHSKYTEKITDNIEKSPKVWKEYLGQFTAIIDIKNGVKAKNEENYIEAQQFFEKVINDLSDENLEKRNGNYSFWLTERLREDAQKFLEEIKYSQPPPTNNESKIDGGN